MKLASRAPFIAPAYSLGLILVFLAERGIVVSETVRWGLIGLGLLLSVGATGLLLRAPDLGIVSSADAERRSIYRQLGLFAAIGLFGVLLYFLTTDGAIKALGVALWSPDARAKYRSALLAAYALCFVVALLPLLLGEIALAPMRSARFLESRRVRAATMAGVTLSLAAGYVALFTYAASHYEGKLDYSFWRAARPSESTKNMAANLPETVRVIAFFPPVNEIGSEVRGYLQDLKRNAPKLELEFYDRLLEPGLAKDAKVTQDGVVVLYRGTQREAVTIGVDPKTAKPKLKSLDVDFQKALLKAMRPSRTAYLTVGHGELNEGTATNAPEGRVSKSFRKLLESQNYTVKEIGVAGGLATEIPKDAFLVISLGPTKALLPEEIASLDRYYQGGGKLMLALDPDGKADMAPLAKVVGLTWSPTVLASDKMYLKRRHTESDRINLVTSKFSSHASVTTLSRNAQRAGVILSGAAALDKAPGADGYKVDFAVKSQPDVFADDDGDFKLSGAEKRATFNLAAAVSLGDSKTSESRAFVVADVDCWSDFFLLGNEGNLVFALDALRWLGGEESFAGAITTAEDVTIEHTRQKDQRWFFGVVFLAPMLALGAGAIATRRAKRKGAASPGRRDEAPREPAPRKKERAPEPEPAPQKKERAGDDAEEGERPRKKAKKSARRKP